MKSKTTQLTMDAFEAFGTFCRFCKWLFDIDMFQRLVKKTLLRCGIYAILG